MDLRLEPLSVVHVPHVMTWVNDREVMHYFANRQVDDPWKSLTRDIDEAEERIYVAKLVASPNDRAFSLFDGNTYVGQVSLNQIYWPARNARLFVVIRRDMQGRGYGTKAVEALLAEAFGALALRKVWLIVRKDNRHAQAMYLRLGFDFEGVLRDEYAVNGTYYDMVRMAVLAPPTTAGSSDATG